jgi:signal peptidase I
MKDKTSKQAVPEPPPPQHSDAPIVDRTPTRGKGMNLRWFVSARIRHATAIRKHVQKILNHQRDILSSQAVEAVTVALGDLRTSIAQNDKPELLEKQMGNVETVATKWLKPYPNAIWRENIEVLLVALAVAMGIRTFFLQPFKIPTGSMQPTLYGVTSIPDYTRGFDESSAGGNLSNLEIPRGLQRVREWFAGASYLDIKSKADGELERVNPPKKLLIFSLYQSLVIGGKKHHIFLPPDYGNSSLERRAGLRLGTVYRKGDPVVRMKVVNGDHLFVDRVSYNFRQPNRGEIIVFETKGIPETYRENFQIPADQFYIKRLVGLGGETVQLGEDRHLIINGKRLDSGTPHFEKVYSCDPKAPPRESHYSGHVNRPDLAPFFRNHPEGITIPTNHFMTMGDNTLNSLDSRAWGYFPANYLVGKSFFVYWPITERFGWGYHR